MKPQAFLPVLFLTLSFLPLHVVGQEMEKQSKQPPIATRVIHTSTHHGIELTDSYFWLKDQSYPHVDDAQVLKYLEDENAYFEDWFKPVKPLADKIFEEIKGRQVENESTVPVYKRGYLYQSRYQAGKQYQQHIRWKAPPNEVLTPPDSVQILLDENQLAEGKDYLQTRGPFVSPNQELFAYGLDDSGAERFELKFRRISDNTTFNDSITKTSGVAVWSSDGKSLFYVLVNEEWRPYRVMKHVLGTDVSDDQLVYEEKDEGFFVGIDDSTSERYLLIETASHTTSEVWFLRLDEADTELQLVSQRENDHLYSVDHRESSFYIHTNDQHKNFRIASASETEIEQENWETVIEGRDDRYITGLTAFKSQIVVTGRENANDRIYLLSDSNKLEPIEFPEAAYSAHIGANPEPDPSFVRLGYSSLTTPNSVLDYAFETGELVTRKIQEIPSGYDRTQYETIRLFAPARDGEEVPVTLVYRKSTPLDGSAPLYLYGYGAYGYSIDPNFRTSILSLLDRGFVYAIAHIRGGSDKGFAWYEAGKLNQRTNTFNDFVDVARHLIVKKYTSKGKIAIAGGSAGGSLMGVVVNDAPELWGAVAAHVPFVDILNTMLDHTLPLTPIEWPEWGNPIEDEDAFKTILSYSPYDQLKPMEFPPLFVTAGINDPRVTYWEPAKWVAKIRHLKTDSNPLIFRTDMDSGHGGKSGRYDALYEVAEEYAFILTVLADKT